jgi:ATP/maltotriose-dependent transcriptional regulator MalT
VQVNVELKPIFYLAEGRDFLNYKMTLEAFVDTKEQLLEKSKNAERALKKPVMPLGETRMVIGRTMLALKNYKRGNFNEALNQFVDVLELYDLEKIPVETRCFFAYWASQIMQKTGDTEDALLALEDAKESAMRIEWIWVGLREVKPSEEFCQECSELEEQWRSDMTG